jgi:hypothetical protein
MLGGMGRSIDCTGSFRQIAVFGQLDFAIERGGVQQEDDFLSNSSSASAEPPFAHPD